MDDRERSDSEVGAESHTEARPSSRSMAQETHAQTTGPIPRKVEDQFMIMFDNSPVMLYCVDHHDKISHANRRWLEKTGYSEEETLGKSSDFPMTSNSASLVAAGLRDGPPTEIKVEYVRKDGNIMPVELSCSAITDASGNPLSLWAVRPIGEERVMDAVPDGDDGLTEFVRDAPIGVFSCDSTGRIGYINSYALDIFGIADLRAAQGVSLFKSPRYSDTPISGALADCLSSGEAFSGELSFAKRGGSEITVKARLVPQKTLDGEPTLILGVVEDITDQKNIQGVLIRSERYKAVSNIIDGLTDAFGDSLQSVAKATKSAITSLEARSFSEVRLSLGRILDSSIQSARTLRQLQLLVRPRSATEASQIGIVDLSNIVNAAVEMCGLRGQSKLGTDGTSINLDLDLQPGLYIDCKYDELLEVVANFLRNAEEALPEGGGISVKTLGTTDTVTLKIQDDGSGLATGNIERMIQPFWTTKPGHVGMGLAVNFAIIRRHGGRMGVKRLRPRGTSFSVRLPRVERAPHERRLAASKAERPGFRILLIDDDRRIVEELAKGLNRMGNIVFSASSGQEGLDIFEGLKVDAIVCDLAMDGMNGWEVGQAIEALCRKKRIHKPPFIMLTGWGGQLAEDELAHHPEVDRIVEKPVTILRLIEIIGEHIKR